MPGSARAPDTVRIALTEPVDPGAPESLPQDPAEATLRAAVYETLLETDCRGRVLPALATEWTADSVGTRWTFVLRPETSFGDGSPLTPHAVIASWTGAAVKNDDPRAHIENISVIGADRLIVELDRPATPSFFADPRLAIHRGSEGTGAYAFVRDGEPARRRRSSVRLRLADPDTAMRRDLPLELHFVAPPSGDLRTALDLGADLVITRDAAVVDYARALADYSFTPLPWDRTYVLVSTAAGSAIPVPESVIESLARDAVGGDARAAPPITLMHYNAAIRPGRAVPSGAASTRIVFPAGDDVARRLAERLVALAASPERAAWLAARIPDTRAFTARGLQPREFATALMAGRDAAYVMALPDEAAHATALGEVPWLGSDVDRAVITPLVQTRATAIHRAWLGPVRIDANGTLRFGLSPGSDR